MTLSLLSFEFITFRGSPFGNGRLASSCWRVYFVTRYERSASSNWQSIYQQAELISTSLRHVDDFSLISNHAFMVTNRYPCGSLDVYPFRTPSGQELSATPMRLSSLKCTSLLLPALQASNQYAVINSHTSPFTAQIPKGAPFATSEEARIHVLSVTTQPSQPSHSNSDSELSLAPPGRAASFVVVVVNRIMLKYC